MSEFETRGIRVAALSVDPPELNHEHASKLGITFPLLSDTNAVVLRKYDMVHSGAGPQGTDIARPAEFLIDSGGTVRWRNLTANASYRLDPENALAAEIDMREK